MRSDFIRVAPNTYDFCGDNISLLPKTQKTRVEKWRIRENESPVNWRTRVSDDIKNPKLDFGRVAAGQLVRIRAYPGTNNGENAALYYFRRMIVQYCTVRRLPMWWRLTHRKDEYPGANIHVSQHDWTAYLLRLPDQDSAVDIHPALLSLNPDPEIFGAVDPVWVEKLQTVDLGGYVPAVPVTPLWELPSNG